MSRSIPEAQRRWATRQTLCFQMTVRLPPFGDFASLTYMRLSQEVFYIKFAGKPAFNLQQTQLTGAGNSFRAPLYPQFVKDFPIVPFDGIQGEEESFADLVV